MFPYIPEAKASITKEIHGMKNRFAVAALGLCGMVVILIIALMASTRATNRLNTTMAEQEAVISELRENVAVLESQTERISDLRLDMTDLQLSLLDYEDTVDSLKRQVNQWTAGDSGPAGDIETADPLVDISDIALTTEETDYAALALLFMQNYGDALIAASKENPDNADAITDFEITTQPEVYRTIAVEGGAQFSVEFEMALKPVFFETTPWWAGNTAKDPREGWLKMGRVLTLVLGDDGTVTCVSFGTGR
jgi:hypothetical protein